MSGRSRGDGLDPAGACNLYATYDMVPSRLASDFQPQVRVCNWQAIALAGRRDDWIDGDLGATGRFMPASLRSALQKRARHAPGAGLRRFLGNWRDLVVLNDEAHHAHGTRRSASRSANGSAPGEEPAALRWSSLLRHLSQAAALSLVVDVSATPWRYSPGSDAAALRSRRPGASERLAPFEWVISDFPVEDAWESGLIKTVRLPLGKVNLYARVKRARDAREFALGCREPVAQMVESWREDFLDWRSHSEDGLPPPVLLFIAQNARHASWLFEHLMAEHELLANPDPGDPGTWVTLQVDSSVFDANRGSEDGIREKVATIGRKGAPGEHVRCLIGVQMLSEGWDVQSVTHIVGLRAFESKLMVEQIVGRGLRRRNYDALAVPPGDRGQAGEETVDVVGIPVAGFPVQKRQARKSSALSVTATKIAPDPAKVAFRMTVPNVRGWVPLAEPGKLRPLLGQPGALDTALIPTFGWSGPIAAGQKAHSTLVPCRSQRERNFAAFLDSAPDVARYVKNERFGFAIPCPDRGHVRGHSPAFIVETADGAHWVLDVEFPPDRQTIDGWCKRLGVHYLCLADVDFHLPGGTPLSELAG